jgi:subtilisin family serine protease
MDDNFHGTHVAGIIGSVSNNGAGGAGVAWRVQLMATKILGADGSGSRSDPEVPATHYAADNGARVSNNSWWATNQNKQQVANHNELVNYALEKGMLFVTIAGNNGWDNDQASPHQSYPGVLDQDNIITVAASTRDDQLASFSGYGLTSVDLAAPGDLIGSTIPVVQDPSFPYAGFGGTSQAAPFVTGAAALLLAQNPNLSYAQIKELIIDNVDPLPAFAGKTVSGGRLNVYKALAASAGITTASVAPPSTAPLFSTTRLRPPEDLFATAEESLI